MDIGQELFLRKKLIPSALEPFGFVKTPEGYSYSRVFMDGQFRADITIGPAGEVSGKVFDLDSSEEYLPIQVRSSAGSFVGTVREEYTAILKEIAGSCFGPEPFIYPQTNRTAAAISAKYGEDPDHPFKKLPSCAVFRYAKNAKWYALIMDIKKGLLKGEEASADKDRIVEVMNIKIDPERLAELLELPGFYPAYHMNHKSWISMVLDDSIPDDLLMELINKSREFAVSSSGRKKKTSGKSETWIVPANPAYYDIESAFKTKKGITWKQGRGIRSGDIVYMYVAAPVSAVKYKCVVTEADIPYEYADNNVSMTHIMKMDLLKKYPDDLCPFAKLRELGVKAVRGPRPATDEFLRYIEKDAR